MSIITEDLMKNFDLFDFLSSQGRTYKNIGGKTKYLLDKCPFCDKEWHCGFSPERQYVGCFRCGHKGTTFQLVQKLLGASFSETIELIKDLGANIPVASLDRINISLSIIKKGEESFKKPKEIQLPEGYYSLHNRMIPYLQNRGLTQEQVNYYKVGICFTGKYHDRVIVCDVNENQQPIYWIARDISGTQKRYKILNPNAETYEVGSSDVLFNYFLARNYKDVVLVEGIFGSLWVGNNCMATYSKVLKESHLFWLLIADFDTITLMYDSDVNNKELDNTGNKLSQFFHTRVVRLDSGQPDDFPREEINQKITNAPLFKPQTLAYLEPNINKVYCQWKD